MTIAATTTRTTYQGTGSTGPFAFAFRLFSTADLLVTRRTVAGADVALVYGLDFSLSVGVSVGDQGGSIVLASALLVGEFLSIRSAPPLLQPVSLQNQAAYFAKTHEDEFDRLVLQIQSLMDRVRRSVSVAESFDPSGLNTLIVPQTGASIGFLSPTQIGTLPAPVSSGVTLPGEGRTVASLTAYLLDGRVYNVLDYGAIGDGVTDDAAAIALAVANVPAAGGVLYFPKGTYKVATNLTIPRKCQIVLPPGAVLAPTNAYVRVQGQLLAGRYKIFALSGTGQADFRDWSQTVGFQFSNANDTCYPEWWGALTGDGGAGATDCSPAIQAAVNCGVKRILFGEGFYKMLSTVLITDANSPVDLLLQGVSRTGTYLMAGQDILDAARNAMFRNVQTNGKLSFDRLRFHGQGGVSPFLGWAIWAVPETNFGQTIFSGEITNCWVSFTTAGGGFFTGSLNNYLVRDNVFEGMRTRFQFSTTGVSPSVADVQFIDNVDFANVEPFIDLAQDAVFKNVVSIRGLHAYSHNGGGALIRANNCNCLTIDDVTLQLADSTLLGSAKGALELINCRQLNVANVKVERFMNPPITTDFDVVFALTECAGLFINCLVDGGVIQMTIQGAVDLVFTGCSFINAQQFGLRMIGDTSGRVKFFGSRIQYAGLVLWQHQAGTATYDILFQACDLLDGGYGAGSANYDIDIGTAGEVRFQNCRLGRSVDVAGVGAWGAGVNYKVNDIKSDGGVNYRCVLPHLSVIGANAAAGTLTAAGGAGTFSVSQAGVIVNGSVVIVGGVQYTVSAFSGTTTCTLSGAPTFGASAFSVCTVNGNEPGVGLLWTTYWRKHTANLTAVFKLSGTGPVILNDCGPVDGTAPAITGTSTQAFSQLGSGMFTGSVVYDPPNLVDGAGVTTTVTVSGAKLGDIADASFSLDLQGITVTSWVSAADTVSVRFQNESGGALDLASGTLKADIRRL